MTYSVEMEEFAYSDSCRPSSVQNHSDIFFLLSCDFESIYESCEYHDSRPVLVIMHDRDVELSLQTLFDLEASRCRDIFEVDPTESIGDMLHRLDELFDILCADDDRKGIDSCKLLEEHTLPFHDRHTRPMSEIPESENRRTI